MSPYLKGALGFLGCAGICTVAYKIGKSVGREETLKEVEQEERIMAAEKKAAEPVVVVQTQQPEEQIEVAEQAVETQLPTPVQNVRKRHGFKNKIFGTTSVIKDLIGNPDGKQLTMTVEDGDIVARISQKQGG